MGKKVTVTLFDDFEPELEAEVEREFTVDGVDYHLDLSEKNAKQFDADQAKWTEVAQRIGKSSRTRRARSVTHSGGEPGLPLADIRKWAKGNGFPDVSTKGRVSAEIVRAWKAAGSPEGDDITEAKPEPAKKAPAKKAPTVKKDEPAFSAAGQS
ncbi:nucloid associated Lsr2-like [Mycobacterium phage Bromden]|uniref:Lsr2-like DNA bridging protein n=1 Tax=Mycobacterium phage Bromden TaxID=2283252 RepID=A0A345MBH0_9CAUD|nr:nucloid associated Lsr2-like [Mycobacterium phage Bromden]AXH67841.1 Lsr2-like DNA bridging protein [Mycobacterium phage Bromden]